MTEEKGAVVRLEQALSDRSTCRATGEKIEKGGWRVGLEVWLAGRMSWTWQVRLHPRPRLPPWSPGGVFPCSLWQIHVAWDKTLL